MAQECVTFSAGFYNQTSTVTAIIDTAKALEFMGFTFVENPTYGDFLAQPIPFSVPGIMIPKIADILNNIMTGKFNFFDEVNDKSDSWKVRARISRMWEAVNLQDKTQSYGLHMLLLDEKNLITSSMIVKLMKIGKGEECRVVTDPRSSKCQLALKTIPNEVYEIEWDLIMVDAPTGFHENAPGRMSAIYTAGMIARNKEDGETDVFVHDVDRLVEDKFSKAFLCERYMRIQEGRLRHFTIPSQRHFG
ncbi:hypothetical protein IFM89_022622 [Coptis chinensis]|uniref:Polysaccharide biosynthesis domain-containing protein n=1 Tax=Coptis chinensis TaxID=261450 RepID=A0A835M1B8_9MAGN|nr:hypothetical protein IFM89_022622 [Coptis chinensis]